MNIFEDLIEELKEENLIEETVIETSHKPEENRHAENDKAVVNETVKTGEPVPVTQTAPAVQAVPVVQTAPAAQTVAAPVPTAKPVADSEKNQTPPVSEADFYNRRAMDEAAFLQIVEHVFAGVEREQLKIVPKPYNDLEVKKRLHAFVHLASDAPEAERSKAEFQLMQETESWHSSLSLRDERLTTAHLRRYCETSRPALSSPALVALARFYRNSPYSEPVRNKFDLVVTRLFSKESEKSRREMVFTRDELAAHLTDLYAEWSSVSLYSSDEEINKIVLRFEGFMQEADEAMSFDELIKNDFFTRLHSFKRTTNENFYAPVVTAVGVESNIRIGNRYVELLETEKHRGNINTLENRYGFAHDSQISEATGKTFSLIELLKQKKPAPPVEEKPRVQEAVEEKPEKPEKKEKAKETAASAKSYKWLIAAAAIILIIGAIYFATKSAPVETRSEAGKPKLSLENSMLKEYLVEARIEEGTLIGRAVPTWSRLSEEKRKEVLKQMVLLGGEKNYKKVQLDNKEGRVVAIADGANILLFD